MRCFIALEVSDEVRHSISRAAETVKSTSRNVRWIPADHIHLTLKFLGETGGDMAVKIEEQLSMLCRRHAPFVLTANGTGGFPNLHHPNVLWTGIDKSEPLMLLHRDVEQSMAVLGFEMEDKLFSPHLTVGRVKSREGLEDIVREWLVFKDVVFGSIAIGEILLMKSILKPAGAEYSKIAGFKFDYAKETQRH